MTRRLLAAATVALAVGAVRGVGTQDGVIGEFFRDFTAEWVRADPDLATAEHYFTGSEQDRLDRELTPKTEVYQRSRIGRARQGLALLRTFDRARLTEEQSLSADLMAWQLDTVVREEPFLDYTFPLNQMRGANVDLVESLTVRHPLTTERDAENYVAALGQVAMRMEEAIAETRRIGAKGVIAPKFILEATIAQMQRFADPVPAQNPFVSTLGEKLTAMPSVAGSKREQLRAQASKIVELQIYPAWKKAIALMQSQLGRSTNDAGLWRLKGGAEAYAYFLGRYTTTSLTADQIHEIGLREVARIEQEMDTLLTRLGRTEGSVKERIEKLRVDLRYANPESEESRAQIMRDIDGFIRDAEKRAALERISGVRPAS